MYRGNCCCRVIQLTLLLVLALGLTNHYEIIIIYVFLFKGLRTLKETIEDCWDQDGDARLSALCVKERFSELLKDYPDGLTTIPAVNPVQTILQNYPMSHSQSLSGIGSPVLSAPPTVEANPWAERSSSQGLTMTTV